MSIESANHGPVLMLTACVHGNEVGGIVIIQEIFKIVKKILAKGAIYAFPMLNPIGFENASRYIAPSQEDLNRSFPGNPGGSLGERIADRIFSSILEKKPALVVDLHNDWIKSIPHAFLDHMPDIKNTDAYKKSKEFLKKSGLILILDNANIDGTLSYSLIKRGVPAITVEIGEPYVINESNVDCGVRVIINILKYLGMIAPEGEFYTYPRTEELREKSFHYAYESSSSSGIIRFLAKPGDMVRQGQPVARIYNAFGKFEASINVLYNGIVLSHADYSVSYPGAPVMSFGVFNDGDIPRAANENFVRGKK